MSTGKKQTPYSIMADINWDNFQNIYERRWNGDLRNYSEVCVMHYRHARAERLIYKKFMSEGRLLWALNYRFEALMSMHSIKNTCPYGTAEKLREEVPL